MGCSDLFSNTNTMVLPWLRILLVPHIYYTWACLRKAQGGGAVQGGDQKCDGEILQFKVANTAITRILFLLD